MFSGNYRQLFGIYFFSDRKKLPNTTESSMVRRCLRQILRKSWIVISVQIIQGFSIFSAVASRIEFLPSLVFRGTID